MAATATYKRGEVRTLKYLAPANIAMNQVVVCGIIDAKKSRIGVARQAIASGDVGIVGVSGVWRFPKLTGAVIKAGESVGYDFSGFNIDDNAMTTGAGDVGQFGCAMEDAGAGVLFIDVDIATPGTYDAA